MKTANLALATVVLALAPSAAAQAGTPALPGLSNPGGAIVLAHSPHHARRHAHGHAYRPAPIYRPHYGAYYGAPRVYSPAYPAYGYPAYPYPAYGGPHWNAWGGWMW